MAGPVRFPLHVECHAGYRADERPLAVRHGGKRVAVREILDTWHGPDHTYFKLTGDDGIRYCIRHDLETDAWELMLMEVPSTPHGGPR
jgi:hypothetical protein